MNDEEKLRVWLEYAFNSGMAFVIGSHEDFIQSHSDFREWLEANKYQLARDFDLNEK